MNTKTNRSFYYPIKQRIDGIEKSYGVEIIYTLEEKKIQYIVSIAYISSIDEDYHCKIDRKQVFINGVQPSRLIDVLAERCMNCIYPIDFQVNPFIGIKGMLNFDELKKRWNVALIDLKKEYQGDFADQYFDKISQNLSDQGIFFQAIKNEMSYSLLFFRKEVLYEKNHMKKDAVYTIPLRPYLPMSKFIGNQNVYFKDQQMIFEYNGKNKVLGTLELKHILNHKDLTLQKMKGKYKSQEKEISFAITELKERRKKYVEKIDKPETIPKEMIKRKKSWLSNLFS